MKKTEDLSMFKKQTCNRELVEANVQKIMKSIQHKNLLEYRPILVNKDMEIIDGQHRLEACRRLQIPIYYEVKLDAETHDIILLNDNSKNWSKEDYLNYYCGIGLEEYIKLRAFILKNKIKLGQALRIIGAQGGSMASLFREGRFRFADAHDIAAAEEIIAQAKEVIAFTRQKLCGNSSYIAGSIFLRALYLFLSIKAVDFTVFMDKLNYRLDLLRPCARLKEFIAILKKIYNWRNRSPIQEDEETMIAT